MNDREYDFERQYTTRDFEIVDRAFEAFNQHIPLRVTMKDGSVIGNCFVTSVEDYDALSVTLSPAPHGSGPDTMKVRTNATLIASIERG